MRGGDGFALGAPLGRVPRTIVSAGLLLVPSVGLVIVVSNLQTPFGVLLLITALANFDGGNFASSMSNITFFYPAAQKGWALGLNAAGGNLGASVAQFVVPIVITVGAAATLNLPLAGLIWAPLILVRWSAPTSAWTTCPPRRPTSRHPSPP